jgi:methylated-DNA-[protein]-cysteine S-methyltransferase
MVTTQLQTHVGAFLSPLGWLKITTVGEAVSAVDFCEEVPLVTFDEMPPVLCEAREELMAYFRGTLREFSFPIRAEGTEFQVAVWKMALDIPFGRTTSYWHMAKKLEHPEGVRGVAQALAKNPVALVVPCHRVIAPDGKLTSYTGGIKRKKWLLEHERGFVTGVQGSLF